MCYNKFFSNTKTRETESRGKVERSPPQKTQGTCSLMPRDLPPGEQQNICSSWLKFHRPIPYLPVSKWQQTAGLLLASVSPLPLLLSNQMQKKKGGWEGRKSDKCFSPLSIASCTRWRWTLKLTQQYPSPVPHCGPHSLRIHGKSIALGFWW